MGNLEKLTEMLRGVSLVKYIPNEAVEFAKDNNIVFVVGGSDDLMYCYGADSYMVDEKEHDYGWGGDTLIDIPDKQLEDEARQLGLEIYWCGLIVETRDTYCHIEETYKVTIKDIPNYNTDTQGGFSFKVNNNIKFKEFIMLDEESEAVYCTGIAFELPKNFKRS